MEEPNMAYERNPNEPFSSADDEYRRSARLDNELQPDPELAEGPASGGRVAMFAVAIALILGAVFYGLNNTSINQASTSNIGQPSVAQNNPQPSPQAAPPGMRDVTPGANNPNNAPGVTTGAAPARPQAPPSAAPTGQDMNRSGNPPTDAAPPASK
jgi:hypothetical protein